MQPLRLLCDDWCHQVHVHRGGSANEALGGAGLSPAQDVSFTCIPLSTGKHCAQSVLQLFQISYCLTGI